MIPIDVPTDGSRRERVTTTMDRLAAAFEDLIADAPDQWWAVFFPIWADLEGETTPEGVGADRATPATGEPPTVDSSTVEPSSADSPTAEPSSVEPGGSTGAAA